MAINVDNDFVRGFVMSGYNSSSASGGSGTGGEPVNIFKSINMACMSGVGSESCKGLAMFDRYVGFIGFTERKSLNSKYYFDYYLCIVNIQTETIIHSESISWGKPGEAESGIYSIGMINFNEGKLTYYKSKVPSVRDLSYYSNGYYADIYTGAIGVGRFNGVDYSSDAFDLLQYDVATGLTSTVAKTPINKGNSVYLVGNHYPDKVTAYPFIVTGDPRYTQYMFNFVTKQSVVFDNIRYGNSVGAYTKEWISTAGTAYTGLITGADNIVRMCVVFRRITSNGTYDTGNESNYFTKIITLNL